MLSGSRTVDPVTQEIIEGKLMATSMRWVSSWRAPA